MFVISPAYETPFGLLTAIVPRSSLFSPRANVTTMSPFGGPPSGPVALPDQVPRSTRVSAADTPAPCGGASSAAASRALATSTDTGSPSGSRLARAEDALYIADRLGQPRQGIVLVLLVFETDQVWITNFEERPQDRLDVQDAATDLDVAALRVRACDVLHV